MNRILRYVVPVVFLAVCFQSPAKSPGILYLESSFKTYDDLQKSIHRYAELGYQEVRSSEALASHLEANGFKVERAGEFHVPR